MATNGKKANARVIEIDQNLLKSASDSNVFFYDGDPEFIIILARKDGPEWESQTGKMNLIASSGGFKDVGNGLRANVTVGRSNRGR